MVQFEPTASDEESPFNLVLTHSGEDFAGEIVLYSGVCDDRCCCVRAVMGMHFKLGLYEHQSAGALQVNITRG